MVSSCRRKVRRYLLGATQKATRMWWIGQITVRVMYVERLPSSRTVREKAHHGAEKSRLTRRRKRGLRKNRDRGNADPVHRQPIPKSQSSRKVNHIGRKHIWALKAVSRLRKDCERLNKFPRGPLPLGSDRQRLRLKCKMFCLAKYQRYRDRAVASGVPLVTCFHSSFWDFLLTETNRCPPNCNHCKNSWDLLLAVLPRRGGSPPGVLKSEIPVLAPTVIRRGRGGKEVVRQANRACRMCGYVGPGPHAWNSCRPIGRSASSGVPTRQRGRSERRRCGCLRGAKCPH